MKTNTFLGLLLTIVCATACKKERSCECTTVSRATNIIGDSIVFDSFATEGAKTNTTYTKISKRDIESKCISTLDSLITESSDPNAYYRSRIILERNCIIH